MTIAEPTRSIIGGIDTRTEFTSPLPDDVGRLLGSDSFRADPAGYAALVTWLEGFGAVTKVGVEGTGSYGPGICRFLMRAGIEIIEVDRHHRQARRNAGKSGSLDAVEAAVGCLSGKAGGQAKSRAGCRGATSPPRFKRLGPSGTGDLGCRQSRRSS